MNDVSRRDVVKVAAVGAAAVVTGLAATGTAAAQEKAKVTAAASLEKVTADLIAAAGKAAAAAGSPEEAYKRFMTKAGKGMMQVMADALAYAVSGGVEMTKGKKGEGWEKFVKGCVLSIDFGAPVDIDKVDADATVMDFQKVLVTKLQDSVKPTGGAPKLLGGTITVGGSWSF